jgi:hypothetical protein
MNTKYSSLKNRVTWLVKITNRQARHYADLHCPLTSYFWGSNIFLSTLFKNTLILCSSLNVRDQVSHSCKITDNRVFVYILIFILLWMQFRFVGCFQTFERLHTPKEFIICLCVVTSCILFKRQERTCSVFTVGLSASRLISLVATNKLCVFLVTEREINVQVTVFWDVMSCILVGRYQRFGGMRYIHLQGRKVNIKSDMVWMKLANETCPPSYVRRLPFLFPLKIGKLTWRRR